MDNSDDEEDEEEEDEEEEEQDELEEDDMDIDAAEVHEVKPMKKEKVYQYVGGKLYEQHLCPSADDSRAARADWARRCAEESDDC